MQNSVQMFLGKEDLVGMGVDEADRSVPDADESPNKDEVN